MLLETTPVGQAKTVAALADTHYELPESTTTGIVCADCSWGFRQAGGSQQVRHASVEHVRFCNARTQEWRDEARAEQAAELRNERFFEDRGYEEARFQEQMEAHLGILI